MNADTLAVATELTTWAMRGKAATVMVILFTLWVIVARAAARHERIAPVNEDDRLDEINTFAPQHAGNRLTFTSSQVP